MINIKLDQAIKLAKEELQKETAINFVARYGHITPDGTIKKDYNNACHAGLGYDSIREAVCLFNWFPRNDISPVEVKHIELKFISWITGPHSPWYPVTSSDINTDLDFIWEHGWVIHRLDQPKNYIVNFCIATRFAKEYPARLMLWGRLVSQNINPSLAFILASGFTSEPLGYTYTWHEPDGGHYPLGVYTAGGYKTLSKLDVYNFCMAKPNKDAFLPPFKNYDRYTPCNTIWYSSQVDKDSYWKWLLAAYPPNTYKLTIREFCVEATKPVVGYSVSDIIETGVQEQKRMELPNVCI